MSATAALTPPGLISGNTAGISAARLSRGTTISVLVCLAALIVLARLHTYHEPLERDLTTYAVVAHQMVGGKSLYSDAWDHKPPAIHSTYAIAEWVAGYGRNSIFLMNVCAAMATLLGCYFAGRTISGHQIGGLFAAGLWTIVSGDLGLEANQPNTEVFINAMMTAGFAIFLGKSDSTKTKTATLLAGVLFALASLYKQIAVAPVALICLAHIATSHAAQRKKAIADVVTIGTLGALVWAAVFAYFAFAGHTDAFIDAVFIYNQAYAGNLAANLALGFSKPDLPFEALLLLSALGLLTLLALVTAWIDKQRREPALLLAWVLGSHMAVLLPGQFFAHYYQLLLPPLVIGAAWSLTILLKRPATKTRGWIRVVASTALFMGLLAVELPAYFIPADAWSFRKYGAIFVEADRVAAKLNEMLAPNETFYEWGSETGLYFDSKRNPPARIFFADPLLTGPLRTELWLRVAEDLDRAKPDVIVLEKTTVRRTPKAHPVLAWVRQEYRPISKGGIFLLLARKGSRIERAYAMKSTQPSA